ncbi:hypothetical protein [Bifidobacterium tsurumiense]|uniref:LPXTG cell wall anchor domain protein n=1 Tax=Bifidobacterium tsurumiense TaxID=356829 RepID=A0A087E9H9_9BIFI|nr:hypothetical protein [Bifidobacterium tsurumiense]KFJ04430.1 LPXTG cell wall anchor domain protein [Bifidobacterium tsurumiense]MDY4678473.1 hypothetical protein [Bifidobacterium tsurumiense]
MKGKQYIRGLLSLGTAATLLMAMSIPASAADATDDIYLPYLYSYGTNGMPTGQLYDQTQSADYWTDLQKFTVSGTKPISRTYTGLLPQHLLTPDQTDIANIQNTVTGTNTTPSSGIVTNNVWPSYNYMPDPGGVTVDRYTYHTGTGTYLDYNPFGFAQDQLPTKAELGDAENAFTIFGDLKSSESDDSTTVGDYTSGAPIDLTFSLNATAFKRYFNANTMLGLRMGTPTEEQAENYADTKLIKADAQIALTVDIPEGVTVSDPLPQATLTGLPGFTATTSLTDNGSKLLVNIRMDNHGGIEKIRDRVTEVNSLDLSNVQVSITGLSVADDASTESPITIRGTAAGIYDQARANSEEELTSNTDNGDRTYMFFAAKQSDEGRDAGADAAKPNQISYTFNVTEPEPTVVDPWKIEPEASDPADCADNPYVKTATTEGVTYTVTDSKGNDLTADSQGRYNYQYGDTVTVTATANDGYAFPEGTTATRTFTAQKAESCNTNNSGNNGNSGTPETPKGDDTTSNNKPAAKPTKKPHAEKSLARTGSALAMPVAAGIMLAIAGIALTVVNKKRESADR